MTRKTPVKYLKMAVLAAVAVSAVTLSGCDQTKAQTKLCEVTHWRAATESCKDGDVVSFLPDSWGNEQQPLIAASVICDLRYHVVSNTGGVVCVYDADRIQKLINETKKAADTKPAAPAAQ